MLEIDKYNRYKILIQIQNAHYSCYKLQLEYKFRNRTFRNKKKNYKKITN